MDKKLLGVHLVVRDEETFLSRCLSTIRDLADEVIIVDTGSTDGTLQIARSSGARVIETRWEHDFSKARNLALEHATTEWVLVLDADEALVEGQGELLETLHHTDAEAFEVHIENWLGPESEDRVGYRTVRLFRADRGYRFTGNIHEQIAPSILGLHPPSKFCNSSIKLVHYGYLPEVMQRKNKLARNIAMIQDSLTKNPRDPFQLYNLGVSFCQSGKPQAAYAVLQEARSGTDNNAAYRPTLIRDSAKVMIELQRYDEACQLLQAETARYRDYPDLYCLYACSLEQIGLLAEAYQAYEHAAQCVTIDSKYVIEAGMNSYRPRYGMATISARWGDIKTSESLQRAALKDHPRFRPSLLGLSVLLKRHGCTDEEVRGHMEAIILPACAEDNMLLSGILTEIGAFSTALPLLRASQERLNADGKRNMCECLMQTGQFIEAYKKLDSWKDEIRPLNPYYLHDLALCRLSEGKNLPYSFYEDLPSSEKKIWHALELWIQTMELQDIEQTDPILTQIAKECMDRAVQLRLLRIASKLSELNVLLPRAFASRLYRNGFLHAAAEYLLRFMEQNKLDAEGLFMLGEILYDKGHFGQSVNLFEQAAELDPNCMHARTGAALSYLEMASELISECLREQPDDPTLRNEWQRVENSKKKLTGLRWHTEWNGVQRRNFNAAKIDLPMHDR
ncbi:glycosyltransferase [Paenibacillus sp. LHD-117]|uniref:glycosyltransferase n=1 Tax=Paenibacillus sp. LHD-117 TaxID=3071412 RepID=UPI0027E1B4C6|nr:glycosyltransferase [Paenibacillus sp. LHD-117]MDQ6422462.1 glycosyltransferase [Paenibacillus sp. LHD-117]